MDPIPFSRQEYDAMQGIAPTTTSIPPPPTYEQYLDNASYIGTTPLSREQYNYINNTPTPPLQSTPPTPQGWMGIQEPDWIRNAPGLFDTPQVSQTPRVLGRIDLSNIRNTTPTSAPIGYSQTDIDEARRVFWDNSNAFASPSPEQVSLLEKHGYGSPPPPPDPWEEIANNLKQNKKSTDAIEDVKKQLDKDKNVTGRVEYHSVGDTQNEKLLDKTAIVPSDKINSLITNFEDVLNHMPPNHKLRNKVVTQLEDLKATKWLREEYAKEIKTKGAKPKENLSIVTSSSGHYSLKHLVDEEGNIIGSIDIDPRGYVGSSGLAHNYHGVNFDRLNLGSTDAAQTVLEQRLKTRNLEALQNSLDRGLLDANDFEKYKVGTESSAKEEASKIMQRLQENNDNKFGEALYRAVHHGIKDTKGPLKSSKHFVHTNLRNPITGELESAKRGELGWKSWSKNKGKNDMSIDPKAIDEVDPNGMEQFRMLRSLFPYIGVGALGANALQEEKYGGWLDSYK